MKLAILTSLFTLCVILTQAQVVEKTEEKAKQKTEQRIDQKIDNGIDSGLDAIEGLFSKKKKKKAIVEEDDSEYVTATNSEVEQNASTAEAEKMVEGSKVQVQDEYKFDHRFVIVMEDFNKKGKQNNSNEMTFLTKEESSVMGILMTQDGLNTEVIYNMDSYEIISLMNTGGQKIGTKMSIPKGQVEKMMSQSEAESNGDEMGEIPTFKKTGQTKTISGYSCDEYVVENLENGDSSTMAYWITDELDIDWIRSMANMSSMNKQMPDMYAGSGYPEDGSVIQMIIDQKNGERTTMTLKEVETNQNITISTEGYTFMNMGGK